MCIVVMTTIMIILMYPVQSIYFTFGPEDERRGLFLEICPDGIVKGTPIQTENSECYCTYRHFYYETGQPTGLVAVQYGRS